MGGSIESEIVMRVLVVEDEPKMADLLRRGLERAGYAVDVVDSGEDALWMATEWDHDCIVLDVGIPPPDGFEVSRRLREKGCWAPILLLTVRDSVADRVAGLDAGADDYLTKPFAFDELLARVRALTRRPQGERSAVLVHDGLRLDPSTRAVTRDGVPIGLTPKEFALLEFFLRHREEVLTRSALIDHVWDFAFDGTSNIVDVYVGYLRNKIDRPFGTTTIETVRGVGYRVGRGDG